MIILNKTWNLIIFLFDVVTLSWWIAWGGILIIACCYLYIINENAITFNFNIIGEHRIEFIICVFCLLWGIVMVVRLLKNKSIFVLKNEINVK
jgi:type II secretory pathway component PulF